MKITYFGHSCFLIETLSKKIIVDPFISANELAQDIDIDAIEVNYVLLTHGHADHVADAERIAKNNNAMVVSNFEIVSWYEAKGVSGHPLNHGGGKSFDFGHVKYVNAVHSSVLPDGTYGGNPGGFIISNEEATLYVAGDTALTMDMKLIPLTSPKLDAAILPIGDNFTMNYEDAVIAADFIGCDKIIGCHYDTFGYIKIDHQAARQAFTDKGKTLILINIGDAIEL